MASARIRQACIKCQKGLGTTTCGGCEQRFCKKHFVEHRQELAIQIDHIGQEHDLLQRDLIVENITDSLLSRINQWEEKSIEKIKVAAEEARTYLRISAVRSQDQIKTSLSQVTTELQSSRESDDYTEIELDKWMKQLKELRSMTEEPINIEILHDDDGDGDNDDDQTQSIIRLIQVRQDQTVYSEQHPNRLIADIADTNDDNVVTVSQQKMDELQLFRGDLISLKGRKNRNTIAIVLADDAYPVDRLRLSRGIQKNIEVRSGDVVLIEPCVDIKYGKRIVIWPIGNISQDMEDNLFKIYLRPYFDETYRPVRKGHAFVIETALDSIEFKVMETDPSPYCIVAPDTIIICEGQRCRKPRK